MMDFSQLCKVTRRPMFNADEINTATPAEAAVLLADYGFNVIPCRGKIARVKWQQFQNNPAGLDQVREWWEQWPDANPAILTDDLVVVDADTLDAIAYAESHLPRTPFQVSTPNGRHFYFARNPVLDTRNSAGNGLDVRGAGGYVIAAGAAGYSAIIAEPFDMDGIDDLPPITPDALHAVNRFQKRHPGPPQSTEVSFFHTRDIKPKLTDAPVAEGSRNETLARLVGRWINDGRTVDDVHFQARGWNTTLPNPLSNSEVDRTVKSLVGGHNARNPGTVVPAKAAPVATPLVLLNFGALRKEPPPEPESYWNGPLLFQGARMIIAGAPKKGKSRFALDLAVALATSGEFLGVPVNGARKVVWLQAEIHEGFLMPRLRKLTRGMSDEEIGLLDENLAMTGRLDVDITQSNGFQQVANIIAEFKPDVIILDPVIDLSSVEENNNVDVRKLLRQVDRLAAIHGAAAVLVHHVRKTLQGAQQNDVFDKIRGGGAFRGWYDTGIILGEGEDGQAVISFEARNCKAPLPSILQFNAATGRAERLDDALSKSAKTKKASDIHRENVLKFVPTRKEKALGFEELFVILIGAQVPITEATVRSTLSALEKRGAIKSRLAPSQKKGMKKVYWKGN